jgi:integrase
MTISFFQRGSKVAARVSDGKQCFRVTTGLSIPHHIKFTKRFEGRTKEAEILNNELAKHRVMISEVYREYGSEGLKTRYNAPEPSEESLLVHDLVRKYVQMMRTGDIKTKRGKNYSIMSSNSFQYVSNILSEFAMFKGDLDLSKCHLEGTFEKKSEISNRFSNYFKKFEDYMIGKDISIKSRGSILNIVGIVLKHWADHYFIIIPKIHRLEKVIKPIVVLPPELVQKFLSDNKLYQSLDVDMKTAWEISATILITTMRISDVLSLNEKHLTLTKDQVYMNKKNQKTGAFSQMPLPKFLSDIYRENLARHGRLFSAIPNKFHIYYQMKDLFRTYEECHEVYTISRLGVRGEDVYESKPLYEWVHPHMLRKTAITTMLFNGVPERYIKFASGHTENSEAFGLYVGHNEKNYKNEVINYYNKFTPSF